MSLLKAIILSLNKYSHMYDWLTIEFVVTLEKFTIASSVYLMCYIYIYVYIYIYIIYIYIYIIREGLEVAYF